MDSHTHQEVREIIVHKLRPQISNPSLGLLKVIAEYTETGIKELNEDNFCPTGRLFVTKDYGDLDQKFADFQLFKVFAIQSKFKSEDQRVEKECRYVTTPYGAEALKPKELIEIIQHSLPDPNQPLVDVAAPPTTPYIYLEDYGKCFGPFKWTAIDDSTISLSKIDSPLPGKKLPSGVIFTGRMSELERHYFKLDFSDPIERSYFKDLGELHNDSELAFFDYSSDEDVVNNFVKIAKDIGIGSKKVDLAFLESSVKKNPRFEHFGVITKLDKLKFIAEENQRFKNELYAGFEKVLQSDLGQQYINKYITNNEDTLLSELKERHLSSINEDILSSRNELNSVRDKIAERTEELVKLGKQIEKAKSVKLKSGEIDNIAERESLDEAINQKKAQLAELNAQIRPLLEKYKALTTLQDVKEKIEEAEIEYNNELKRHFKIEEQTKALEAQLRSTDQELSAKLMSLKPFVESINGNINVGQKKNFKDVSVQPAITESDGNTAKQIIDMMQYGFEKEGRNLTRLDVINLMVTSQQSFIFFLAGLPGGGKTSLARIFARLSGIYNKRFLDIPVARGWSGQKDLIGFFNPISGRFQSSSTGMYEFLQGLGREFDEKGSDLQSALSLVLLDEANLSPMEHYWSSFMGLSDSLGDKKLVLGDETITIPDSLRFVGTINYDGTTEHLSPRLIDRSPILVLEANNLHSLDEKDITSESIKSPELSAPISYEVLQECFGVAETLPEFTDNERTIFLALKAVLEDRDPSLGRPIIISSRKEIAVRQYCNKARPLMREASSDDDSLALDYAVLQLILPLVRGHGRNFGRRLEQLREVLVNGELEKSASYLESMIVNGESELNTYDFFCW